MQPPGACWYLYDMNEINVMINGRPRHAEHGTSLLGLLEQLELDPRTVVVELNREIVRRPHLQDHAIHDGDEVELVHFVGGG